MTCHLKRLTFSDLSKEKEEIQRLKKYSNDLESQVKDLTTKADQSLPLEKAKKEVQQLNSEIQSLQTQLQQSNTQLEQFKLSNETLSKDKLKLQTEMENLELKSQQELLQLRSKLDQFKEKLSSKQKELDENRKDFKDKESQLLRYFFIFLSDVFVKLFHMLFNFVIVVIDISQIINLYSLF